MQYKIGVTYVYNGHVLYIYYGVITRQSYPPLSQFNRPWNKFMSV